MEKIKNLIMYINENFGIYSSYREEYMIAFTHSSYINENRNIPKNNHYERLEFLGDAIIELTTSEYLYKKFQNLTEGDLTRLRASIVCEPTLVKYSKILSFDKYILLGKGEEKNGGRNRDALLADIFESFVGALYLDRGLNEVKKFLNATLFKEVTDDSYQSFIDHKTILQELISKEKMGRIEYKLISSEGPSHAKVFISSIYIDDELYGQGKGKTKKESEQKCAEKALKKIKKYS
ncbi:MULTISPECIES: ribonuclease III [unclassified Gemella]|uniref:ribonuclease III n=1 Tax=unclassified Gemella TaxID=2624949 RepID=UPI0010735401|nr:MULTISPECIES: ribonuclease III [unclassified Gemella]MBF0710108.1 ribonuclease III [Gemella sp. GL1.1]MBF0746187.1 ribonuclease III [Gemella sp. 19428wG2_WT2a]NYS27452.1 ribonuclease III [Gemella sp. GL1]TFU60472.1 ribonuclease III [Gemella sp. WT2a]